MKSKSAQTTDYIIETVAPIFNKKGYDSTSLSDIIAITGLTKGAVYGNFESKEDLAIKVFLYNVKRIKTSLADYLGSAKSPTEQLRLITEYYREYYDSMFEFGGCPILNVTIDTKNINPVLYKLGCTEAKKMEHKLAVIIENGIKNKEFRQNINPDIIAKNIYSMIEGSVFTAFTHQDKTYITNMMDLLTDYIRMKIMK
jgi:TetR/AcrR family transcriptional regulator, transcriptional repressor for nem operon